MRIKPSILALSCCIVSASHAASVQLIWEAQKPSTGIRNFAASTTDYQWRLLPDQDHQDHVRYQLYYQNIPVWGQQQIRHQQGKAKGLMTGMAISGIEKDLRNLNA